MIALNPKPVALNPKPWPSLAPGPEVYLPALLGLVEHFAGHHCGELSQGQAGPFQVCRLRGSRGFQGVGCLVDLGLALKGSISVHDFRCLFVIVRRNLAETLPGILGFSSLRSICRTTKECAQKKYPDYKRPYRQPLPTPITPASTPFLTLQLE